METKINLKLNILQPRNNSRKLCLRTIKVSEKLAHELIIYYL